MPHKLLTTFALAVAMSLITITAVATANSATDEHASRPVPLRAVEVDCPSAKEPRLPSPVIVSVAVDANGKVTEVTLAKSTGSMENDKRVVKGVKHTPFRPAGSDKHPKAGETRLAITIRCP